jgi:hypothetical protein
MAKSPEEMKAAMIAGLRAKTGKSLEDWLQILRASKLSKHKEFMNLLKSEHALTHGYANMRGQRRGARGERGRGGGGGGGGGGPPPPPSPLAPQLSPLEYRSTRSRRQLQCDGQPPSPRLEAGRGGQGTGWLAQVGV